MAEGINILLAAKSPIIVEQLHDQLRLTSLKILSVIDAESLERLIAYPDKQNIDVVLVDVEYALPDLSINFQFRVILKKVQKGSGADAAVILHLNPLINTLIPWHEIEKHPAIAKDLLSEVNLLKDAVDIPFSHHENWDGSGYPQG